jgi:pyridoxal phosphate enzyme (YggS family)
MNLSNLQIEDYKTNFDAVKTRVEAALRRSGRPGGSVRVVAVSKTMPPSAIAKAHAAGITCFGENRPQELAGKLESAECKDLGAEWHMVGHLQSNKVKLVVGRVSLIHSVDRVGLAAELSRQAKLIGARADVLLEVNVAGEASKQGFALEDVEAAAAQIAAYPNVSVLGLMTVAPLAGDPENVRWVFEALNKKFLDIDYKKMDNVKMVFLSMGMSFDYEVAIEEGSNMVRIGTAIFGSREPQAVSTNDETTIG